MILRIGLLALLLAANVAADAARDYEQARGALTSGDLESALDAFEAALSADPGNLQYGNDYRLSVIKAEAYDRCLEFFEKLTVAHPTVSGLFMNYGFAHVDKIPSAGAITRVLLANTALQQFTKALEIEKSWLGLYTRGSTYLYWPKVFDRAPSGVADLEEAYTLQQSERHKRAAHVRVYTSLGDGYWKTDDLSKATATWREGAELFPDDEGLQTRLSLEGDALAEYLATQLDPNKRVDTDLSVLWADESE